MKDKMLVRIVLVILGSAVMGLSINLLVAAGFGLDPLSLFQAGLCNVFHISLGQASQLLMTGIIIILFFLDRKRIGIGSILNSILVGAFVNFFAAGFPAGAGCSAQPADFYLWVWESGSIYPPGWERPELMP